MIRLLTTDDFFEKQPEQARAHLLSASGADDRAFMIIAPLLAATRANEPADVLGFDSNTGITLIWADKLSALAEELPDSSYAPYAAFYAGCCYSAVASNDAVQTVRSRRVAGKRKDRADEAKQRSALMKDDLRCSDGLKALRFASNHGDAYLRPRALYQQAWLLGMSGKFEESSNVLSSIDDSVEASDEFRRRIAKLRKEVSRLRKPSSK